jgi:hypothetical protein
LELRLDLVIADARHPRDVPRHRLDHVEPRVPDALIAVRVGEIAHDEV